MAGIRQLATSLSGPLGRLLMLSDTAPGGEKKKAKEINPNQKPCDRAEASTACHLSSHLSQIIHLINSSN